MSVATREEQDTISQMFADYMGLLEIYLEGATEQEAWWLMEFSNRLHRCSTSSFAEYTEDRRFWFRGELYFTIQQWNMVVLHFTEVGRENRNPEPPGLPRPEGQQHPPDPQPQLENEVNEAEDDEDDDEAGDEI